MTVKDMAIMRGIKNLASATLIEAAREYCEVETTQQKNKIIKDLNTTWMDFLTDGMSINVARELQRNGPAIKKRLENIHMGVN